MGLLSRSKKPAATPAPSISAPISHSGAAPVPDYGKKYAPSQASGYSSYGGSNEKYGAGRADLPYGALPSPPGSPIEAHGRGCESLLARGLAAAPFV